MSFLTFLLLAQSIAGDSAWSKAMAAAAAYPDTAAARAAGFVPLARGDVQDLSPFQGQHWLKLDRLLRHDTEITEPTFVMFVPVSGTMKPVGVAYSVRISHDEPVPERLDGVETAWHLHQVCFDIPGEGRALADGVDDCRARGGTPTQRQIAMVHAWTGAANPEGAYAHDNLALPYLAAGLAPPAPDALQGRDALERARRLGLALGETYGARLPYARRIDLMNGDAALAEQVERHRSMLRRLVPSLQSAQQKHDSAEWNAVASRAIAEWSELFTVYATMAKTPEIKTQLERQRDAALGLGSHAHH